MNILDIGISRSYLRKSLQGAGAIQGASGKDGFNPTISENPENTDDNYCLDITDINGTFTTPNLKGIVNAEMMNISAGPPVGEILAYMGNTAPVNYLICDGAIYDISDYPFLTKHFINEFGIVNFFGGDGTKTFAVPDLRGEFLRGSGGYGSSVGYKQLGTSIPDIRTSGVDLNSSQYGYRCSDYDETSGGTQAAYYYSRTGAFTEANVADRRYVYYRVRPRNMSILWCIKYKPTYFINIKQ